MGKRKHKVKPLKTNLDGIAYDLKEVMGYQALINMIVGPRSTGKTFEVKVNLVTWHLNKGHRFVYVRRYEKDRDSFIELFEDIKIKFPEMETEIKGDRAYINGELVAWFVSLNNADGVKSRTYPDCKYMLFDEFLPESERYLPNEVKKLLSIIQTIARAPGKVIDDEFRVFMLANNVSMMNPYFEYFNVRLQRDTKITYNKDNGVLVQVFINEAVKDIINSSRWGKLLNYGDYGKYANEGDWWKEDNDFIEDLPNNNRYLFTIKRDSKSYGVHEVEDGFFISNKPNPTFKQIYVFSNEDHSLNYVLIKRWRRESIFTHIKESYDYGEVRFTDIDSKRAFLDIIQYH